MIYEIYKSFSEFCLNVGVIGLVLFGIACSFYFGVLFLSFFISFGETLWKYAKKLIRW